MKLYIGEKKNKVEGNQLAQIVTICDFIKFANSKSFFNIDVEEFNHKSNITFQEYLQNYFDN